jgi:glucose/arabinose dehydrogenase
VRAVAAAVVAAVALGAAGAPASAHAQAGVSYQVPADNPFVNTAGALGEIFAFGMRNPYRWSFDRLTGDLYIGDVGGTQEEITFLPRASAAGANLGWNCWSGTAAGPGGCDPPNDVMPAFSYPSSGDVVIGGYVVRDPSLPSFTGNYVYARYDTGLYILGPGASGPGSLEDGDPTAVSSLGEDANGGLYATSLGGPLYRIAEQAGSLNAQQIGTFTQPLGVTSPPGDASQLFVVEKPGRVMLRSGSGVSTFLDIASLVSEAGGEEGLLAFAVAPDYATSGRVYVFYTDNNSDLQLDEYTRTGTGPDRSDASTRRPVMTIPHQQANNHNGGQLLFGPDGYLYLSTGDGGTQNDPEGDAQSLSSLLGKVLRVDPRPPGTAPAVVQDTTPPTLRVRAKRRQRVRRLRGVVAYVRCSEACSVAARGRLRIGRARYRMRPLARAAQANRRVRLKVRLTQRGRRALRRADRRGRLRRASVRLNLRATDSAGLRSPLVGRTVRVRR